MRRRSKNDNRGFTLIEVILSIAILALVSIPLMKYFSDSLRHSALMAQKQKATLVAQETIEHIKAQESLVSFQAVKESDAVGAATVKHYDIVAPLKHLFGQADDMDCAALKALQPAFDCGKDKGTGTLEYEYTTSSAADADKEFDIRVTLSTNVSAANISRPIIYGIDETTNVVASEHDETMRAVAYFLSMNTAALESQSGIIIGDADEDEDEDEDEGVPVPGIPTPAPAPVEAMTEDEIREKLERTIYVEIADMATSIGEDGYGYTVKVYYEYYCENVASTTDEEKNKVQSDPLLDTSIQELEGLYLMFNKLTDNKDVIEIKWSCASKPAEGKNPEFVLICQNLAAPEGEDPAPAVVGYELKLKMTGFGEWTWPAAMPQIRTNICDSEHLTETPNRISLSNEEGDGRDLLCKPLTSTGNPVRLFDVTVEVYPKGAAKTEDNRLVRMETTKGE